MLLISETTPQGVLRQVSLRPAYDTFVDHSRTGGIHNAELYFTVSRSNCTVDWRFSTGWFLKKTRERPPNPMMAKSGETYQKIYSPDGLGSISYHSPVATYEGQEQSQEHCVFTHGPCFSDSTYTGSGELFDQVLADPEVLWRDLEERLEKLEAQVREQEEMKRNFS